MWALYLRIMLRHYPLYLGLAGIAPIILMASLLWDLRRNSARNSIAVDDPDNASSYSVQRSLIEQLAAVGRQTNDSRQEKEVVPDNTA